MRMHTKNCAPLLKILIKRKIVRKFLLRQDEGLKELKIKANFSWLKLKKKVKNNFIN